MRLLLDEMFSPRIPRELREMGHDVQAIERDRPELPSRQDRDIVQRMAVERRAVVTSDVVDFEIIHSITLAAGEHHAGFIFTFDEVMPRSKAAVPVHVARLAQVLEEHADEEPLRNRMLRLL